MARRKPQFRQHISLTRLSKGSRRKGLTGHLDDAMLVKMAPDFMEREVYICGPEGFMRGTQTLLQELGFPMAHCHQESFEVASSLNAAGGSVLFAESGIEVACTGTQSILEVAEQAGVAIGSACRTGDCGECKVRRIDGDVVMANCDGLGAEEIKDGYVLTCVSAVNGRVTLAA